MTVVEQGSSGTNFKNAMRRVGTRRSEAKPHAGTWTPVLRIFEISLRQIEAGIPAASLPQALEQGLTPEDLLAIIPRRTLERRIAEGQALKTDEADCLARLGRTVAHARRVFGTDAKADRFLRTPHPAFDDRKPISVALTDAGAREVETILGRIEHGVYS